MQAYTLKLKFRTVCKNEHTLLHTRNLIEIYNYGMQMVYDIYTFDIKILI